MYMETIFTFDYNLQYGNTIYIYLQDKYWITEIGNYLQVKLINTYMETLFTFIYTYMETLFTFIYKIYIELQE